MSARLLGWCNAPCGASTIKDGAINLDVLRQYNDVNKCLVQHDDSVGLNINVESERRYSFIDIAQSDMIADMFHQTVVEQSTKMLLERHLESKEFCTKHAGNDHVLDSGGWCLTPGNTASITWKDNTFMIPHNHVLASGRIASELLTFIEKKILHQSMILGPVWASISMQFRLNLQMLCGNHMMGLEIQRNTRKALYTLLT